LNFKKIINSQDLKVAAIGSIFIKFSSAFFALINAVLLTRLLTVEGFGTYILAFTTVSVLSIPVALGLPELITRYISKYEVEQNLEAIKGLLIRANVFVIFSTLSVVIIALILYAIWWKSYDSSTVFTFWYSLILLPLLVYGELRAAALRGLKYIILGQMPDTFIRNLLFTIPLFVYFLLNKELDPQSAMLWHCVAAFISFMIGMIFLNQKLLRNIRKIKPIFHQKLWLKEAIPFTLITSVQVIKIRSLVYFLAYFWNVEMVAIYDVANRGATLVSFTVDALNKAISPYISAAYEKKNSESLQIIVKKSSRLIFAMSFPVALIFIFGGKSLISWLFGAAYKEAYLPLVILCVGHIFNTLSGPLVPIFNMTNNQKFLSNNQIVMMIISLIISTPLIYYLDVVGAAIVFSTIIIVQNIFLLRFIKNKLHIDSTIF
jgi:O-antigen/teichoic acid export membrane protein